ncbi:MAG TPA: methionyl-tRNA formyltransferase [Tepidisphaeraceae bacterium]|jgi:methionyl-tRNA formyltransferase
MRIIFTGSGEFGIPTLAGLLEAGQEIVAVCTQPDRPAGRGRKITPTAISQFALGRALHVIPTGDINSEKLPDADLMVVIAFGQKISSGVVDHARLGSVNLHASRLPKYRGAAPINWAILNGESETGNSIIRLAQKMDAGNILAQSSLPIGEMETAGELHDRLAKDGAGLMLRTIADLEAGKIREIVQDESRATLAGKLSRQIAAIDWTKDAVGISRKIRGMYPWPGCRVRMLDAVGDERGRMTLVRGRAIEGEGPRWHPGEIAGDGAIACGEGAVELMEIQPDDKRAMSLSDYRRGNPWMPGMRLESI